MATMAARIEFDIALSHRMYAQVRICFGDAIRFEPCGLSQMISMRYARFLFVRARRAVWQIL